MPRNADKSYDLAMFLPWLEKFCLSKQGPTRIAPIDPLKSIKAEKIEIELSRQKGELLDRQIVLAGFLARYQSWLNALTGKKTELALACQNQPAKTIEDLLNQYFDEVRRKQCEVADQLRLPEAASRAFAETLALLAGHAIHTEKPNGGAA